VKYTAIPARIPLAPPAKSPGNAQQAAQLAMNASVPNKPRVFRFMWSCCDLK
jgi:hypothetical protein